MIGNQRLNTEEAWMNWHLLSLIITVNTARNSSLSKEAIIANANCLFVKRHLQNEETSRRNYCNNSFIL